MCAEELQQEPKLESVDRLQYKGVMVAVGGPPHSGKSVFLAELYKQMLQKKPSGTFLQRACPDGEGMWSAESDPEIVAQIRRKGKFSSEFVNFIKTSTANLGKNLPRVLLDLGGVRSAENAEILKRSTHLVVIADTEKYPQDVEAWRRFAEAEGCELIAVFDSKLYGNKNADGSFKLEDGRISPPADLSGFPVKGQLVQLDRDLQRDGKTGAFAKPVEQFADWLIAYQENFSKRQEYTRNALRNLEATSRTASGVVDSSASLEKHEHIEKGLTARQIAEKAKANFAQTFGRLYDERKRTFKNPQELRGFVEDIAQDMNDGLVKRHVVIRWREDSSKFPYTKVADLSAAMEEFYSQLLERLNKNDDPKELAAWIEYRMDLTDHFFADGCGKTAKAIAAWVLMRTGSPLPKYRGRDEYYKHAPKKMRGQDKQEDAEAWDEWHSYYKTLFV